MAISIVVSDRVKFKVSGTITQANGAEQPFDFFLVADRLKTEGDQRAYLSEVGGSESATPITDTLLKRLHGWAGPKDAEGKDVPYSEDAFRQLMELPGVAYLAHTAYLRNSGAKSGN